MPLARSKLTAQGQISVPSEVRRKLGIGPGSVLEWSEEGDRVVVQRAAQFSFEDIHKAIFRTKPKPRTTDEMKEGIRRYIRERYARR
jgi:AbrB family looped-hinge helix DNA binding protein